VLFGEFLGVVQLVDQMVDGEVVNKFVEFLRAVVGDGVVVVEADVLDCAEVDVVIGVDRVVLVVDAVV